MSNEQPKNKDRVAELEAMVLQQGEQISELLSTQKALQSLLSERVEAKITPATDRDKFKSYVREQARLSDDWQKKHEQQQLAFKQAAEAGQWKFKVCIFSRQPEHDQFRNMDVDTKPWECEALPAAPWATIGVDAPSLEAAMALAKEKYNRVMGIRDPGQPHTIFQIDERGRVVDANRDAELFRKQIMERGLTFNSASRKFVPVGLQDVTV